mgnify:CR=1 FL=1
MNIASHIHLNVNQDDYKLVVKTNRILGIHIVKHRHGSIYK